MADSILSVKNVNQYYGGSHILRDVSLEAHLGKVTVLHEGAVLAEGTLDQVQSNERVIEVYLGR